MTFLYNQNCEEEYDPNCDLLVKSTLQSSLTQEQKGNSHNRETLNLINLKILPWKITRYL